MKIKSIRVFKHALPVVDGPYTMSSGALWAMDSTLVRLETSDGIVGWGETCPLGSTYAEAHAEGARAALAQVAPSLVGQTVKGATHLHRLMDQRLMGHSYAKAALDIAYHDALGQHLGLSVADLLGGLVRSSLPSYYATGIGSPDEILRLVQDKVQQGFERIQIKAGGTSIEQDEETVLRVGALLKGTAVQLAVDANRAYSVRDARRLSQTCRDVPFILEQPCATLAELRKLRPFLHHPLYMDENATDLGTVVQAVGEGLVDGFGMKVTRLGGFNPMRAFRDICEANALPHTCDDSWGGDIIAAACVQIGATVAPKLFEGVWLAQPYIQGHYDPVSGPRIEAGKIAVSSKPGLGLNIEEGIFGKPIFDFSA